MIKNNVNLSQVKSTIEKMHKKEVDVLVNLGRNKFVSFSATLEGVYPALFTVSPTDKTYKGKTTYSYSEYMCGKIKLKEKQS